MITRLAASLVFLVGSSIILPQLCTASSALAQQATVNAEPSGPKPSPAVQELLDEAKRLADGKQPLESLKAADQSLEAARQTNDAAAAALAQQARAKALQDLQRMDEALTAWEEAAKVWGSVGQTPEQITALVQAGFLRVSHNKIEGEKFFAQGLAIGKSESHRPLAVAQVLHDSGVALGNRRQMQTGGDYLNAALAIREKLTPDSVQVVETLNALGDVANIRGESGENVERYYKLTKGYCNRARALAQRLAPGSSQEAESLHLLGMAERTMSNFDAARGYDLAALEIQRKLTPEGSRALVDMLSEIGVMEDEQTNYLIAHKYLEEAVAFAERVSKEPQLNRTLENLAVTEMNEGYLPEARAHLLRVLASEQRLNFFLGPIYLNLGGVVLAQNDFASGRDYFEKALVLFTSHSPEDRGVGFTLENLMETFHQQGDLVSALEYGRRALAFDKGRVPSIPRAQILFGIGDILRDQDQFSAAADNYHMALDILERLSPDSLDVSNALVGLARIAHAQGNRSLAVEYDRRALNLGQKSCPNLWCVTGVLNDLGELAYEQDDLSGSESYLRQAVDIREKSLGPTHPDVARSLNSLARTVAALGRTPEALEMALRAESIGAEHLRMSVRTLSERQALAYAGIRASGLDLALTLTENPATTPYARGEVLSAVIRSRALVFDELAARHRSVYAGADPEVTQLAEQLLSSRTRLATLVFRGVGDTTPEAYRVLLDDARERKEKAERMLAEKSNAFRRDEASTHLALREVETSLPQGTALVAFVRYASYDLRKPVVNKVAPKSVPSYAAFVLRAGKNAPGLVQLGAAREIETLLTAWRRNIAQQAEVMEVSSRTSDNANRRFGVALRRKIWDPLIPEFGDAREVFVVPDAALHLLNLASLPTGNSRYLIETGPLIHYVSTERDLVPAESRHGTGILIVGNPAFDQTAKLTVASNQQPAPKAPATGTSSTILRGYRSACGTFQSLRFPPLPASQQEVENIAALWKKSTSEKGSGINPVSAVQPGSDELLQMTGADASPQAFEEYAPGKRVLHLATHGFFLEGSCDSTIQRRPDAIAQGSNFLPATAENPLLLSGLAFAGANRRASAKPDETDGILTAEEIAGINLEGVDWAVLSACDTGVGEIKIGEGVFGLRRAFQVAGAKTVIMSLWQVEDETTRQWMETMYREHFLNGKDTGESVRAASLQILRQRRAKHQSTHPFYWGAFIAAGDWH